MSLSYLTQCDCCKRRKEGWNEHDGWVSVTLGDMAQTRNDYCPECWAKMGKVLELAATPSPTGEQVQELDVKR